MKYGKEKRSNVQNTPSSFNKTGATEECDEGQEAHQIPTEGIFCLQHYEILNEMERSMNSVMSPVL